MAEGSIITDEMRAAIGRKSEPVVNEIEKGAIRKFAEAIGDPNPLYFDEEYAKTTKYGGIIAPPTFLCTCRTDMPALPSMPQRGLNGGNAFELYKPVRPGDVITAVATIADFQERPGRLGNMLIQTTEITYTNQKGELVGKARNTGLKY